jgi:uncharacterized protein (TIGR02996 family)
MNRNSRTTDVFPGPARPLSAVERQLIDAVADAPDDDQARQVLADFWMQGTDPARGELVALQLAGGDARDVLDVYWQRWLAALDDEDYEIELVRGFARHPLAFAIADPLADAADTRRVSPRIYRATRELACDHRDVYAGVSWRGEPVALKVGYRVELSFDPLHDRELAIAHPHIVRVVDDVRWRDREALAFAWAGEPPAIGERVAESVGRQIALALAALHAASIVHHAVMPKHILVDAAGHARLGGFGQARSPRVGPRPLDVEENLPVIPNLMYLSPRIFAGHPEGSAGDVFALGVTMFELATGFHPLGSVDGLAMFDIIQRIRTTPYRVPSGLAMSPLLERMLALDAADRPPAAEVAELFARR